MLILKTNNFPSFLYVESTAQKKRDVVYPSLKSAVSWIIEKLEALWVTTVLRRTFVFLKLHPSAENILQRTPGQGHCCILKVLHAVLCEHHFCWLVLQMGSQWDQGVWNIRVGGEIRGPGSVPVQRLCHWWNLLLSRLVDGWSAGDVYRWVSVDKSASVMGREWQLKAIASPSLTCFFFPIHNYCQMISDATSSFILLLQWFPP